MHNKILRCYNCNSVILSLPNDEINKLNGLNFTCECCGHHNLLTGSKFHKGVINDPSISTFSFDTLDKTVSISLPDTKPGIFFN